MSFEHWMSISAFVVSGFALLLAYVSWTLSHKTERRMVEIEEARDREATRQAGKASVVAEMGRYNRTSHELAIQNIGAGTARNLRLELNGEPASRCIQGAQDTIDRLRPNEAVKFRFALTFSSPIPQTIKIQWEDDSGEEGLYESSL